MREIEILVKKKENGKNITRKENERRERGNKSVLCECFSFLFPLYVSTIVQHGLCM